MELSSVTNFGLSPISILVLLNNILNHQGAAGEL